MSTNIVSILNGLIETSKDGEKGFRKASQDATDPYLKSIFGERADSCRRGAEELQARVAQLGAVPEDSGSVLGALHRGWVDIKSAVTGRDSHSILVECERGEDAAKANYLNALSEDLPEDIHQLVERQYKGVLSNHNLIRDLRDRYAANP